MSGPPPLPGPDGPADRSGLLRTYLRRRGRMTRGQARALEQFGERFRLDAAGPVLDAPALFGRDATLGLEIGFGMGHGLLDWAGRCPDWNLLGAEVYQPGIGATILGLERAGLSNVRLLEGLAEVALAERLPAGALAEVRIFFPDPWPKKRHFKRRLIQPGFVELLASRLAPDGLLWVATDWEDYAHWITGILDASPALRAEGRPRVSGGASGSARDGDRPQTRFESRGLARGHRVWDLRYFRKR